MEIAALFARIGADLTGLEKGLGQTESMLLSAGKKMSSLGSDLTRNLTLPLAALGGIAAKSAIELDAEMRNIQSISKQTDAEIAQLSDTFVEMSTDMSKTTDTAKNLAAGFYQVQSSGFAGADAMTVLEKATKAGSAGMATTETAVKGLAGTLNAYGLGADQAGRVSDVLFETVNRGVVSFDELSGTVGDVVGTAAQAGISFETVGAAIASMTKKGLSGAESVTSLNQLILSLIKPSEDAATAIKSLGYSSGQAMLDALGLQGTLAALSDAGYDSTEALAALFPNVRALRGALALTGEGAQMFVEDMQAMENASGATDAAFTQQTKSIEAQLKNLKNELTALGIELAQTAVPALLDMVKGLKDGAEAFRGLEPEAQKNIAVMLGIAAAAGPVLKIVGGLVTGIGTLAGWFGTLSGAVAPVVAALPGFVASMGAAYSLMAEGAGVWAVVTTGAAGLAVALVPVGIALAGVAAAYKGFVSDTQKAGLADTASTWSKFFGDLTSKGASASTIANEYAKAQTRVNEQLAAASPLARAFVDEQEILRQAQAAAAPAILEAATRYNEYFGAMQRAGMASQALTMDEFNLAKGIAETEPVLDDQAQRLEQLAMVQRQAANAATQMATENEEVTTGLRGMHAEIIKFEDGSEKTVMLFGSLAESVGIFGDRTYYARDQVSRLMGQFNASTSGKKSAFQLLVEQWGLDMAQLQAGAKSALQELQNLLQWMEDNPAAAAAMGQKPVIGVINDDGSGTTTTTGTTDTTGDTTTDNSNDGFQVAAPTGGDRIVINVNNQQAAALVLAEMETRKRQRLARRMGV